MNSCRNPGGCGGFGVLIELGRGGLQPLLPPTRFVLSKQKVHALRVPVIELCCLVLLIDVEIITIGAIRALTTF